MRKMLMLALLLARPAQAQSLGEIVDQQVAAGAPRLHRIGDYYQAIATRKGDRSDWYLPLEAGRCYWLGGAGGGEVRELFLYVWDPDNRRLADNRPKSPTVTLAFCAAKSGMHHVQAKVARGAGPYLVGAYSNVAPQKEIAAGPPRRAAAPQRQVAAAPPRQVAAAPPPPRPAAPPPRPAAPPPARQVAAPPPSAGQAVTTAQSVFGALSSISVSSTTTTTTTSSSSNSGSRGGDDGEERCGGEWTWAARRWSTAATRWAPSATTTTRPPIARPASTSNFPRREPASAWCAARSW
jgi:hypothetical protein